MLRENRFFKDAAWSSISNFFKLEGDDKKLGGNVDWKAQAKTVKVSFVIRFPLT